MIRFVLKKEKCLIEKSRIIRGDTGLGGSSLIKQEMIKNLNQGSGQKWELGQ